jgi:hypothetical protein
MTNDPFLRRTQPETERGRDLSYPLSIRTFYFTDFREIAWLFLLYLTAYRKKPLTLAVTVKDGLETEID